MRLTLRTLLAYVDRVLSPVEQEDLHRRIQQSEDVSNLLQRVKRLTSQSELLSPPLVGKGLGGDPNVVAEYLDDVLSGPRVPELERICLESDLQLAELAHCHHLLATAFQTKVVVPDKLSAMALELKDPRRRAEIESQLLTRTTKKTRRRKGMLVPSELSELNPSASPVASCEASVQIKAPMVASGGDSIRPEGLDLEESKLAREVPEYLVGTTKGRWTMPVAMVALAGLLGILVWQSLGSWEQVTELFNAPSTLSQSDNQKNIKPIPINSTDADSGAEDSQLDVEISNEGPPIPADNSAVGRSDTGQDSDDDAQTDSDVVGRPGAVRGNENTGDGSDELAIALDESAEAPPIPSGAPPEPSDRIASVPVPADAASEADGDAIQPDVPMVDSANTLRWNPRTATEQFAVVLVNDGGAWRRVAEQQTIDDGLPLVIPPATRTTLALPGGVDWLACGPTTMHVDQVQGTSAIHLSLGRATMTVPKKRSLQLHTPAGNCSITTLEGNCVLAVEVAYRPVAPGSILDRSSFAPTMIAIAVEGSAKIASLADATMKFESNLKLGEGWATVNNQPQNPFKLLGIPTWLRTSFEQPTDEPAFEDLDRLFKTAQRDEQSSADALNAIALHRRPETAALAIQTAMLIGQWRPFATQLLNSDRFRSHWEPTLNLARQILASDSTAEAQLRAELVAAYNEPEADALIQLLCGLTQDQLQANGLSPLVSELDSDQLPHRVLAAYHLEAMLGKSLGFQPHAPSRASILQWRRELASKRSAIPAPRDPVWERSISP